MGATRRGRELSPAMRREIIGMREGGISFADIGRELHISEDSARKIWTRREINPSGASAPRSGRPPKLNGRD